MIRVAVTGGRNYRDRGHVYRVLDWLREQFGGVELVLGDARGADALALRWARERQVRYQRYVADWAGKGLAAGPLRNQEMLDAGQPQMLVAFPGGRGTADMVRRATARGLEVISTVAS